MISTVTLSIKTCLSFLAVVALAVNAQGSSLERAWTPDLMLLGESRLRVLFWEIYDASLYVTNGSTTQRNPLHYL